METKHKLELTIRTATLLKSLSQLVGIEDATIARMMFAECIEQFTALGDFIDKQSRKP